MLTRFGGILAAVLVVAGGSVLILSSPPRLDAASLAPEGSGDADRGQRVFWAGGCVSCHAPARAEGEALLRLAGGDPLPTPIGTFHAPNISQHREDGIGAWSYADFANAMQRGAAPDGTALYPAFPFTSYARMTQADVADLFAYLKTLPAVEGRAPDNDLSFPYAVRAGVGLWTRAFLDPAPVVALPADASDAARRGQYLVEGPGHCGECHTPRLYGGLGGTDSSRWLAGGPNPEGKGTIPAITNTEDGIGSWSTSDLAYYFESGFTPDFDSVGGSMVKVQKNLARLPAADREAIAAYLKAVPGR